MKQIHFAEKIGFPQSSLSNYLSGNVQSAKIELLEKIAFHYPDLNLRWVLLGEGEMMIENAYKDPKDKLIERLEEDLERYGKIIDKLSK